MFPKKIKKLYKTQLALTTLSCGHRLKLAYIKLDESIYCFACRSEERVVKLEDFTIDQTKLREMQKYSEEQKILNALGGPAYLSDTKRRPGAP